MKHFILIIISGYLFLVPSLKVCYAQDGCELILNQALEEFNAGHFTAVAVMLEDCLKKNQNREWRQRAYLLLAETHLLIEEPVAAEESYLQVLYANPEYLTEPTRDPIDLVYLSSKFTATPIFSLYGKLGPNVSPVRVINDVTISGEGYLSEKYYLLPGWHAGLGLELHINNNLSLSGEANYSFTAFKHISKNLFGVDRDIVEFRDEQSSLTLPLLIKYSDSRGTYRPYGYVGYSVNFLLKDKASVKIKNSDMKFDVISSQEGPQIKEEESPTLSYTDKRSLFNYAVIFGGGIKYKWGLNYIFFDMRYAFSLTNASLPEKRYNEILNRWPYVDDDFHLDNLSLSIGYIQPLYKPRKLNKARSKSVLRFLKRKSI